MILFTSFAWNVPPHVVHRKFAQTKPGRQFEHNHIHANIDIVAEQSISIDVFEPSSHHVLILPYFK